MQKFNHNGEVVEAIRYEPGWDGHILHRLAEHGIACLHFRPPTETIEIFSYGELFSITDPRHDFDGAEGIIYPGDWIVFAGTWQVDIVPSRVFNAEYTPVS